MASTVNFALLREGTSDDGLLPHLRELVIRAGAETVLGTPRQYSGTVETKLGQLLGEPVSVELIFVHRDADDSNGNRRHTEIATAAQNVQAPIPVVAVVPIQELEAWLLLDEPAIRAAVGRPNGTELITLPKISAVESTSSPKEVLAQACRDASGKSGRRLAKEKALFAQRRRVLLQRLDLDGPIRTLSAWRRLEDDVRAAVALLP